MPAPRPRSNASKAHDPAPRLAGAVGFGGQGRAGFEQGFPDLLARPDVSTLVELPWEPGVAAVICDLMDPVADAPHPLDSRGALKRTLAGFSELGIEPYDFMEDAVQAAVKAAQ